MSKLRELDKEFDKDSYRDNMTEIEDSFRNLTISDNLQSYIAEGIVMPPGEEREVEHGLKIVPKYRIILRQRGDSLITDGDTEWTNGVIYLKNTGSNEVTLTVGIIGA